jgi:fructose transport system permease protein
MNTKTSKLPSIATLGPFIALLVACIFFASQSDRFLSTQNFSLILQQVMVVGVIAIGQTLVILTAGIDLSCGMVMALGSIVMTKFAADYGLSAPVAILCGVAATAGFGLLNGLLVTRIKLPPFIVTLGTLNIAFACTQLYSHAQTVTNIPEGMNLLGVYVLAGVFYGIAAMLSVARTGAGDPNGGQTENLDAITAVVLGGTSLFGGRGVILGSLLGALIVGVFRNGLTLIGVSSVYQVLVTGILVILAVATDQMSRKGAR